MARMEISKAPSGAMAAVKAREAWAAWQVTPRPFAFVINGGRSFGPVTDGVCSGPESSNLIYNPYWPKKTWVTGVITLTLIYVKLWTANYK